MLIDRKLKKKNPTYNYRTENRHSEVKTISPLKDIQHFLSRITRNQEDNDPNIVYTHSKLKENLRCEQL